MKRISPSVKDTFLDDFISYNDILDYVERETNNEDGNYWQFSKIISHSILPGNKVKNRTGIEVQVVWETGATSMESFEALRKDISVDLAIYAKENNLLELDGWNTLNRLASRSKLTEWLVKQAKFYSMKYSLKYKYGFEVPKIRQMPNGNWMNANELEHE